MTKSESFFFWGVRVVAALILLQTLYFKFSGAEESIYIFTAVGMEPWGRIGIGVMELIASVFLLITPVAWLGGLIAFGLMIGAIGMHLTLLGIAVKGDGGYLFMLAVIVLVCAAIVLWFDREKILQILDKVKS